MGKILKSSELSEHKVETLQLYTSKLADYEIFQAIGIIEDISHGYLATHIPTNKTVMLKLTDLGLSPDFELFIEMRDIIANTKMCKHENILKYHLSFFDNENLWTVCEPMKIGSCRQIMAEQYPEGIPSETVIATILRDVLRAVQYMHEHHYIHSNIRADNVLIDTSGEVRICGLHQMIYQLSEGTLKKSVFKFAGDPEWMAPEVISQVIS